MMKPWCMRRVRGGSELKGCFPVRRTMVGFRSTHLSAVASSRESKIDGSNSPLPFCINFPYSSSFSSSLDESSTVTNGFSVCAPRSGDSDRFLFGTGLKVRMTPLMVGSRCVNGRFTTEAAIEDKERESGTDVTQEYTIRDI